MGERPNILFFHVDNLGFGELSCYGGGPLRGVWTERIDAFAGEGFRLTNYCPESQCTPTRSALMTGRHAIRSGTSSVPIGGSSALARHTRVLGGVLLRRGEGNLRTPCIVRWPGRVRAGEVSDGIMHVTDWFTTLLRSAGLREPDDRVIDGIDQLDWLTGATEASAREGYIYWMGSEIYGVKWRNFKLALVAQKYSTDPPAKLASPRIINLVTDPQEREPFSLPYLHSWTAAHFNRLLGAFQASVHREPLIPTGAPLDHVPAAGSA